MNKLAVFASGTGSNAQKIIEFFKNHPSVHVSLIVSNKPDAGVLKIAAGAGIETLVIEKERFFRGDAYVPVLQEKGITHIILAGFLWKIPSRLIEAYPGSILNIHPALLPKYGGKGMYGHFVHEAVVQAGEKESGITVHVVDEVYDNGEIVFQATCALTPTDTPQTVAQKVQVLEHRHFPEVIEDFVLKHKPSLQTHLGPGTRLQHTQYGPGVIVSVRYATYLISFIHHGVKEIEKTDEHLEEIIPENVTGEIETVSEAEKSLLQILRAWGGITEPVALGDKWKGGTMILQPADKSVKPKEVPVEAFFHKIVMARDRLRVLEQNINSHKQLSDEEKINLQQYITRIYGSFTTFNVLFQHKEDWFVGESGQ